MKLNKISIVLGAAMMLMVSCADDELQPIITFDQATKGAYVRLIEESDKLINLFDVPGSSYTYSVEFVDLEQGDLVSEYVIDLVYEDNNSSNGDNSTGPIEFRRFSQADFETNANGLRGLSNITITGPEAVAAAGTTSDDVLAGDNFVFKGRITTPQGTWGADNSSSTVNGAAFRGHFDFTLPAGCPSDLTGTFDVETSNIWCDGAPASVSTTVTIEATGGGSYTFSDWSFGAYDPCYGAPAASWGSLAFQDVCAEVSFTGVTDNYGDTWTFVSEIDDTGTRWTINWSNTFNESGSAVIINPNGWSFTLL